MVGWGRNTEKAIAAFERKVGLPEDGKPDAELWRKLSDAQSEAALQEVQISEEDVKGPFADKIPARFEEKAELKALSYEGVEELLGEKYHASPDLLRDLNPNASFTSAGTMILVPRIRREAPANRVTRIIADKGRTLIEAFASDGTLVAVYPATIGSDDTPTPDGETTVTKAIKNPWYTYDPRKLDFKDVQTERVLKIAPGPNNPVGLVWIDLKREGYGIHGTAEPKQISKTSSHGCVRLANWDALDLAALVEPGAQVIFVGE
jgi:lipoprotein-anchoring transpeptidase ErfK/SrfK